MPVQYLAKTLLSNILHVVGNSSSISLIAQLSPKLPEHAHCMHLIQKSDHPCNNKICHGLHHSFESR